MPSKCIAVDIGASSGRLILSSLSEGKLELMEIHRFKNGMTEKEGHHYWDIDHLFDEILDGLSKLPDAIDSIGIDTWGVDYVLIDEQGQRVSEVYAYRDHRTDQTIQKLNDLMTSIYEKTGIQPLPFNTLYQLYEHRREFPQDFEKAKHLLFIPDYLNYCLTDVVTNEFTESTTSSILNIHEKVWDQELIQLIDVSPQLFSEVTVPGSIIGRVKPSIPLNQ